MFRLFFSAALLIVLIFIISKSLRVENLTEIFLSFSKQQLIFLLLISLLISTLKAWRFAILLKNSNIHLSFWDNFKGFVAGQSVSPLPGGEALRGVLIKHQTGTPLVNIVGPIVVQAFLDIASASLLVVIGSLLFKMLRIPALIIIGILSLFLLFILNEQIYNFVTKKITGFIKKFPRSSSISKYLIHFPMLQKGFRKQFFHSHPEWNLNKRLIPVAFLSLGINLLGGLLILLIARSYGVDLDFVKAIFVYTAGILIQSFGSISPGGLGFTEGGMTGLLLLFNVALPQALAIVILFRLTTLVFTVFLGLLFLIVFFGKSVLFPKLSYDFKYKKN